MMKLQPFAAVCAAICLSVSVAGAQTARSPGYGQSSGQPAAGQPIAGQPTAGQGASGEPFAFQGDQIQPMPDQRRIDPRDPRYAQTYQQQQNGEILKPGGGCLRYGAVGAAGGHLAGHGVLGAIAGCATWAYVRHREKAQIIDQYGRQ